MNAPKLFGALGLFLLWGALAPPSSLLGQCPEPAIPVVVEPDAPLLSSSDEAFLNDFGAALNRFRGMSLEEFREEFGRSKSYLTPESNAFVRGDATGDEVVDIEDAVCALSFLFGADSPCVASRCRDALDVEDDGRVTLTDPIYLLGYLFSSGPPPAAPFPDAGSDPTDDDLACPEADLLDYDPMSAENADLIREKLDLSDYQIDAFRRSGFVVLDNVRYGAFLNAFRDIFIEHLPVYISADALLDTLHQSIDRILIDIETHFLSAKLESMLGKLEDGIENLRGDSPVLDDIAFYTCTARSLLTGQQVPCHRDADEEVTEFLDHIASESIRKVNFFGGPCELFDFSQFRIRGHYGRTEELQKYFKAMMWIQRVGMKFAQVEQHAAVGILLTQLLYSTRAIDEWNAINAVVETFAGTSDSLAPPGMRDLLDLSGVQSLDDLTDDGFENFVRIALETGAGRQLINSQVLKRNPMSPEGFTPVPPAFHLMGQRFAVDSFIFTNLVWDRVCRTDCGGPPCDRPCGRMLPSPLDAWFVLGNRATVELLEDELDTYDYHSHLAALDWIVSRYPDEFWSDNLYNAWLSALRALNADTTSNKYPSVMRTVQWDRRILNTQLASWSHLRHDFALYAKPSYTTFSCEYPDGWVDPYPEFFEALSRFAETVLQRFQGSEILDLQGTGNWWGQPQSIRSYFESLRDHARTLGDIARAEINQEPLTEEQVTFIKSLFALISPGCGFTLDGWYRELIYGFDASFSAFDFSPTVIDIHTDPNDPVQVLHAGVGHANLMLVSVNNACGTRAYVGPVLSYYEFVETGLRRMNDEEWANQLQAQWADELEVPAPEDVRPNDQLPVEPTIFKPDWVYEFVR